VEHGVPHRGGPVRGALISLDERGFGDDPEDEVRGHERLREASARWSTDHPCWVPEVMPLMTDERWPREAKAAILGRPVDEIRP